jgi:hypothetical protein
MLAAQVLPSVPSMHAPLLLLLELLLLLLLLLLRMLVVCCCCCLCWLPADVAGSPVTAVRVDGCGQPPAALHRLSCAHLLLRTCRQAQRTAAEGSDSVQSVPDLAHLHSCPQARASCLSVCSYQHKHSCVAVVQYAATAVYK